MSPGEAWEGQAREFASEILGIAVGPTVGQGGSGMAFVGFTTDGVPSPADVEARRAGRWPEAEITWVVDRASWPSRLLVKLCPPDRVHRTELEGTRLVAACQRESPHPNLMQVFAVVPFLGGLIEVLEIADQLPDGKVVTLAQHVYERRRTPEEALAIIGPLAAAAQRLRDRRLRHQDIRPTNIIRVRATWKLADYGLVIEDSVHGPGGPLAAYPLGPDVQHLARTLYFMLSGTYPDQPFDPLPADAGPLAHAIHDRAIAPPFLWPDRFRTPDDFQRALNAAIEDPEMTSLADFWSPSFRAAAVSEGIVRAVRRNNRDVALWIWGPALLLALGLAAAAVVAGLGGWARGGLIATLLGLAVLVLVAVTAISRRVRLFVTVEGYARRIGEAHEEPNLVRSVLDLHPPRRAPFLPALLDPEMALVPAARATLTQLRRAGRRQRGTRDSVAGVAAEGWVVDRLTRHGTRIYRERPPLPCEGIGPRLARLATRIALIALLALILVLIALIIYSLLNRSPDSPPPPDPQGAQQKGTENRDNGRKPPGDAGDTPPMDDATTSSIREATDSFQRVMQSAGAGGQPDETGQAGSGTGDGGQGGSAGQGSNGSDSDRPSASLKGETTNAPPQRQNARDQGPGSSASPGERSQRGAQRTDSAQTTTSAGGPDDAKSPRSTEQASGGKADDAAKTGESPTDGAKTGQSPASRTASGQAGRDGSESPVQVYQAKAARAAAKNQLEAQRDRLKALAGDLARQARAPGIEPRDAQRLHTEMTMVEQTIAKHDRVLAALKDQASPGGGPDQPGIGIGSKKDPNHRGGKSPSAASKSRVISLLPTLGDGKGAWKSPEPPKDLNPSARQRLGETDSPESRVTDPWRRRALKALLSPPASP